jgi:hypothetical protein
VADDRTPDGGARDAPAGGGGERTRTRKSMLLRLDPTVHDALAAWAAHDLRSVNAQIDWILRQALVRAGRMPADASGPARRGRPRVAPPDPPPDPPPG